MRNLFRALFLLLLVFIATEAWGKVLYKLTDAAGHITYADAVPRGFAGNVTSVVVDTSEHVVKLADALPAMASRSRSTNEEIIRRRPDDSKQDAAVRAARLKVATARSALDDAQNSSTPDDWIYFGSGNPVGMRRAPRPEYQDRLAKLEGDLRRAEEELRTAERG